MIVKIAQMKYYQYVERKSVKRTTNQWREKLWQKEHH